MLSDGEKLKLSDFTPSNLRARITGIARRYDQELRFDLIECDLDVFIEWANASDDNNAVFVKEVLNAIFDPTINFPELARYCLHRLLRDDLRILLVDELSRDEGERKRAVIRSILSSVAR
jgi:hypothetical protein